MALRFRILSRIWKWPMRREKSRAAAACDRYKTSTVTMNVARAAMWSRRKVATPVRRSDLPRSVCAKSVAANVKDVGLLVARKENRPNRTTMKILGSLMKLRELLVLAGLRPTWNHFRDDPIVRTRREVDVPTSHTGVTNLTNHHTGVAPRRRVVSLWTVTGVAVVKAVATRTDRVDLTFRKCRNRVAVWPMTCFVWKCSWPWWGRQAMARLEILLVVLVTDRVLW